jgi:hypothetical protein
MLHVITRTAVVATGIALASVASVPAGAMPSPQASASAGSVSWRMSWSGPRYGVLTAVTAPAKDSAWAIGAIYHGKGSSFLVHWNGRRWRESGMPVRGYQPYAIASSSASNVWMFGVTASGTADALRWNGNRWVMVIEPSIGRTALSGVAVLGAADVWIGVQGTVYHDVGGIWSKSQLPSSFSFAELAGTSDRNMWVVGTVGADYAISPGQVAAYRWSDGKWRWVRMPHPAGGAANILAESGKSVWIASPGKILHWTGRRWTEMTNEDIPIVGPLAPFGADGLWVTSEDLWTGSSWLIVLPMTTGGDPVFDNDLARIPRTGQTWLVGDSGAGAVIMRSAG